MKRKTSMTKKMKLLSVAIGITIICTIMIYKFIPIFINLIQQNSEISTTFKTADIENSVYVSTESTSTSNSVLAAKDFLALAATNSATSKTLDISATSKLLSKINQTSALLPVSVIYQAPELPSGCEVTSLTIVLNYLGIDADKCDLADNYLPQLPISLANLHEVFAGNPRSTNSYGCYSEVIVNTANTYLTDVAFEFYSDDITADSFTVANLSGSNFYDLFNEIDNGNPVIIWGTENMDEVGRTVTWTVDGEVCTWKYGQHCLVLIGYDYTNMTVTMADPISGICEYDMSDCAACYEALFSQAVVIYQN